jgi:hypothetical protein
MNQKQKKKEWLSNLDAIAWLLQQEQEREGEADGDPPSEEIRAAMIEAGVAALRKVLADAGKETGGGRNVVKALFPVGDLIFDRRNWANGKERWEEMLKQFQK